MKSVPFALMTQSAPQSDWRIVHGVAFVLLMGCALSIPTLRRWPWIWLAPFIAYFVLVACVPRLRRSLRWITIGRFSATSIIATVGVMAVTALVLILFHTKAQPDVSSYRAAMPLEALGGVIMAGVVFTIVNATLEELVFRGILFDALQSQWSVWVTLTATALLFGLGHLRGYPSGLLGACLAALFGFAMGVLRLWTGGLALPIVAHMSADATIYGILVHSGVV